ncbi:proline-rich receptor-like protein kinase PERK15 isoform X2 [Chenopodium quinoa]|uniref:proline-rich receptor-like protein kinase PERK15 isoform X2 n=1 Tax=Chenopodium quinoa TaxID=63459 RepID=UPI000B796A46|nr:proline-rich receptor-like protein kinase PERK15 isoform X2 [Chenopodium quinoa]
MTFLEEMVFRIFLMFQLCYLGYSEPQFVSSFCIQKSGSYSKNSLYQDNLSLVFSNLTSAASIKGFANFTADEGVDKVYALFYCRGDLNLSDCSNCVETATSRIVYECPNKKEAIVFFEECTLRYANRSIFSLEEEDPNDWSYSEAMVSDKDQFNDVLTAAMSGPMNQAAYNSSKRGFSTGATTNSSANQTVYCLAQCTPDILGSPCHKCLLAALDNLIDEGRTKMSLFMPSCQVMYSLAPFFSIKQEPNSSPNDPGLKSPADALPLPSRNSKTYIAVGVTAALGLCIMLFALWFWLCKRRVTMKREKTQQISHNVQSTFTYEELALATDNFSRANVLGQGGFGFVYKGILPNGIEVAVKQLRTGSAQGEREFQAEVEIISLVHHRHLVSLVGYCISGDQRLLVYEFIPNKTMEFHLHGDENPSMIWQTRLKIALGAAKGLTYLHEECYPKIIHRDIKAANILIDDEFNAKVADFGLAKFFLDTDTHVSTRVVGTFGYLAPEYAASGKLTEKSDVFSFGVVLLELITGRRPVDRFRRFQDDGMVEWARPLLKQALEGRIFNDIVDPRLKEYNPFEMAQMIACAAACVRISARQRPQMSQVLQTLEGNLSAEDLLKESTTDNDMFNKISDDGSSSQHKEDLHKLGKLALQSSHTQSTDKFSASTSELVSTSSTENQPDTLEL